jgi:hypothetical protein
MTMTRRRRSLPAVVLDFSPHVTAIGSVAAERVRVLSEGAKQTRVNEWDAAFEDARRGLVAEVAVSTYLGGTIEAWEKGSTDGGVDVWVPRRMPGALKIGVKSSSYRPQSSHLYVAEWDRLVCDAYVLAAVRGYSVTLLGWAPRAEVAGSPLAQLTPKGPLNHVVRCGREGCRICSGSTVSGLFGMPDLRELARLAKDRLDREEKEHG